MAKSGSTSSINATCYPKPAAVALLKTPGLTFHELDLLAQVFRHHPKVPAANLSTRFRTVSTGFRTVSARFRTLSTRFRTVSTRLRTVSARLRTVSTRFRTVSTGFRTVSTRLRTVSTELRTVSETPRALHWTSLTVSKTTFGKANFNESGFLKHRSQEGCGARGLGFGNFLGWALDDDYTAFIWASSSTLRRRPSTNPGLLSFLLLRV